MFNGPNITNVESCSSSNQSKQSEMRSSSNRGKHAKSNMDFFMLDQDRKMQRAQILFIRRRFRLLEEGLLVEFQNRYFVSALGSIPCHTMLNFFFFFSVLEFMNSSPNSDYLMNLCRGICQQKRQKTTKLKAGPRELM